MWRELKRFIVGAPLSTDRVQHERLSKKKALAVFSSDALSSVAYATEAILVELSKAVIVVNALPWTWPISLSICALLWILVISYRQVINAYPNGGGAYIVSRENLGENVGLIAGASLLIDYILTVAVSVAAGVAAVTSAFPELKEHAVLIGNMAVIALMFMTLRGVRESGTVFAIPTYVFIFSLIILFAWLSFVPAPIIAEGASAPLVPKTTDGVGIWLILIAFSSGCAALTGVEAISNGTTAFKKPEAQNAKATMVWMAVILAVLFLGIGYFAHQFQILPSEKETVVSQLARQTGSTWFYYVVQASTALILFLAANTSFNGFPIVTSLLAEDRYLPRQLASRGDRLVFSNGIVGLSLISMFLIWLFKSDVHLLIPLYAIGVFLSFTLAQAGMVKFWITTKEGSWRRNALINTVGAITTLVVLLIIVTTKFPQGGWIICLTTPLLVFMFRRIHHHYQVVGEQLRITSPEHHIPDVASHEVVIPVSGIHSGVIEALEYARTISKMVVAVYIDISPRTTQKLREDWAKFGMGIELKILKSPYRSVTQPLFDFVDEVSKRHPNHVITVIIPEFVTARWWQNLLHNQTAIIIKAGLTFKKRVVVTSVRYHLDKG
ncbi:MAG: APC family permease [Oligoflexia bacterium]|nr:APC family permease [Oligoflexia bacterium]